MREHSRDMKHGFEANCDLREQKASDSDCSRFADLNLLDTNQFELAIGDNGLTSYSMVVTFVVS